MSNTPDGLLYSQEHEWVKGDVQPEAVVTVGITEYAAEALGDVVYVEAPEVGSNVAASMVCGELESTKAVSELFSPVTGTVVEVNQAVVDSPELINSAPYGEGWIFKVEISAASKALLTAEQYAAITG